MVHVILCVVSDLRGLGIHRREKADESSDGLARRNPGAGAGGAAGVFGQAEFESG